MVAPRDLAPFEMDMDASIRAEICHVMEKWFDGAFDLRR
jgi:hypothetical protein